MKPRHIAVEGPIAVGKTALVRRLARHFGSREVLEDRSNPFLEDFYAGKSGAAFQSQVYFLMTRYRQQKEFVQQELFDQETVCNYVFDKDRIFAYLNLEQDDLNIYERLHTVLIEQVAAPDLVIYLQASDEALIERIAQRDRSSEHRISGEYISELNKAYNYFFFHYTNTPLLAVNTTTLQLGTSQSDFEGLLRQIELLEGGTQYYVPD